MSTTTRRIATATLVAVALVITLIWAVDLISDLLRPAAPLWA